MKPIKQLRLMTAFMGLESTIPCKLKKKIFFLGFIPFKNFKRVFLKTTFLKPVGKISRKLMTQSTWNFAHVFCIRLSCTWTKDFFFSYTTQLTCQYVAKFGVKKHTFYKNRYKKFNCRVLKKSFVQVQAIRTHYKKNFGFLISDKNWPRYNDYREGVVFSAGVFMALSTSGYWIFFSAKILTDTTKHVHKHAIMIDCITYVVSS